MSLTELVPMVRSLPREDKRQLAELLAHDLAGEEGNETLEFLSSTPQEVWSPFDAYEAAGTLLDRLRAEGVRG
jgi:hypothetical protein